MNPYDRSRVSDGTLVCRFLSDAGVERRSIANVVADIAEIDERRLYLPAGYPSMYAYCLAVAHYSESAAYKGIHVGRAARRFPEIFPALADGRLNLSGVLILAPHLTPGNAAELLAAAAHKTNAAIEELLAV